MTQDTRPLLVFFTSERSGPARRMESLLAHLARKERRRLRIHADRRRHAARPCREVQGREHPDARARQGQARRRAARRARQRSPDRGDARAASRTGDRRWPAPPPPPPEIRSLRPPVGPRRRVIGGRRGRRMRKLVLASLLLVGAASTLVVAAIATADEGSRNISAHGGLVGYQEVPATISTTGGGTFSAKIANDGRVVRVDAVVRGARREACSRRTSTSAPPATPGISVFLCTNLGNAPPRRRRRRPAPRRRRRSAASHMPTT